MQCNAIQCIFVMYCMGVLFMHRFAQIMHIHSIYIIVHIIINMWTCITSQVLLHIHVIYCEWVFQLRMDYEIMGCLIGLALWQNCTLEPWHVTIRQVIPGSCSLPFGKHTKNYGKSQCLMGNSTINDHVQ